MTAEREGCQWPHLTPPTAYEANREGKAERNRAYWRWRWRLPACPECGGASPA